MAVTFPTLSHGVSIQSQRTLDLRTYVMNLGNGKTQVAKKGMNSVVEHWTIKFDNLIPADYTTLNNWLYSVGGWTVITWTPPQDGVAKTYLIDSTKPPTLTFKGGNVTALSFDMVQYF